MHKFVFFFCFGLIGERGQVPDGNDCKRELELSSFRRVWKQKELYWI